ncbi:MAG: hypothetical protein J2P59_07785 [Acidimicrobiales bacterium]|nr:hypothetical protein [Acidimicrobiales bacterium]
MNGYVEAGYSLVLAALALYAGRLVLRRRTLERWLPERGEHPGDATSLDAAGSGAPADEPEGAGGTVDG